MIKKYLILTTISIFLIVGNIFLNFFEMKVFIVVFFSILIFFAVLDKKKSKNQAKCPEKTETKTGIDIRTAEARAIKAAKDQAVPRTIKLLAPRGILDTCYSNDEVFVAFCWEEFISDSQETCSKHAKQEDIVCIEKIQSAYMMTKNIKQLPSTLEYYLLEIFNSGKVVIFSKIENKLVDEITRDNWGFSAGSLAGRGGYGYYLPDRSIFFRVSTWVS